jgi:hypothetical protein
VGHPPDGTAPETDMETFVSLFIGVGLSAACGLRVFLPLLVLGAAGRTGHLTLAGGFEWIASDAALVAFTAATILEVAGYYIPWLDNLLDSLAAPTAVLAGTLATASLVTDINPFFKWSLAIIAGGGMAGLVKGATTLSRGTSTLSTGGLANPLLATMELGGSLGMALIAIFVPVAVLVVLVALIAWILYRLLRKARPRPAPCP